MLLDVLTKTIFNNIVACNKVFSLMESEKNRVIVNEKLYYIWTLKKINFSKKVYIIMKLIKLFLIAAGLTLTANVANAQQKIGSVNTEDIFSNLSEVKTAGEAVDNLTKAKKAEIDKNINEYQTKLKAAQDKEKTLTAANKEAVTKELMAAQTELDNLGKKIEDARAEAAKEISAKQGELFAPIQQKVKDAIYAVSKEKGLNYVFDISARGSNLIYTEGGEDITDVVKAKLGASASKPAAGKAKK